jgi:hypothetical protein
MMKRIPGFLTLTAIAGGSLLLGGCALQVRSDINRTAYHAGYCHSFAFIGTFRTDNPMHGTIANPVNESRLRAAITAHMASLGVPLVKDNADCLIGYGIGSSLVVEPGFPAGPYGYGYGYGYWGWGGPWGPWGPEGWDGPYVYHQGVIGIDLYDAKTREALWHASVDQSLAGATGTAAEQKIDAAVAALFTHFPT